MPDIIGEGAKNDVSTTLEDAGMELWQAFAAPNKGGPTSVRAISTSRSNYGKSGSVIELYADICARVTYSIIAGHNW